MHSIRSEIDSILRQEIELAQKDDPALIVRSAFEVIENFLTQGMSMQRIASALQKHDIQVTKGHLVRHLGIVREERGLQPLKRGRKPSPSNASVLAPSTSDPQSQSLARIKATKATPSSTPAADAASPPISTGTSQHPAELTKPVNLDANRTDAKSATTLQLRTSQTPFPEEITMLKFIEVKGEMLDVTRINIDDYLTVSKTLAANTKIPDGMFETIAAENRIRSQYERALLQYDAAIAKWKSRQ